MTREFCGIAAGCLMGAVLAMAFVAPYFALADRASPCRMVTVGGPTFKMGCDSSARCKKPDCAVRR
jgi:hypothetical protein